MMPSETISPKIVSLHWGELKTEEATYKDAKLYPGGSHAWDWNETGTSHVPGIQPADVKELVGHGAEIVILSRGINRRLQTMDETKQYLEEQGIEYEILQSEDAVQRYNALCTHKRVGALIHSTC